ncbi:MAG TPA: hypothetical protein VFP63_05395 [Dehalococcoidia bacterium]|nr:hypothetical protein [Dehalococcoidia bacterium]
MFERRKPGQGDITGETHGDFTDWDNPEDEWDDEDAPEGYDDEDDDSYVPDETDPDYDLSEAHGYSGWEPARRGGPLPGWTIAAVSILLIIAILIPLLLRID